MPVVILGMPRSGTSLIAHMLQSCGLYLGPDEELKAPDRYNLAGYFENVKFNTLDAAMLERLGIRPWWRPYATPDGWQKAPWVVEYEMAARSLSANFVDVPLWGWKAPSSSLTLPFWLSVYHDLKVVVCMRHPFEVAMSVRNALHLPETYALYLWHDFYRRIFETISPDQCVLTFYESYFEHPFEELERVLEFAGVPTDPACREAALAIIRPEPRRSRVMTPSAFGSEMAISVEAIYRSVQETGRWPAGEISSRSRTLGWSSALNPQSGDIICQLGEQLIGHRSDTPWSRSLFVATVGLVILRDQGIRPFLGEAVQFLLRTIARRSRRNVHGLPISSIPPRRPGCGREPP